MNISDDCVLHIYYMITDQACGAGQRRHARTVASSTLLSAELSMLVGLSVPLFDQHHHTLRY